MLIDVRNEVYTILKTEYPTMNLVMEFPDTIPTFPLATLGEIGNSEDIRYRASNGSNISTISLEFNIYDNSEDSKAKILDIRKKIDSVLADTYGMTRTFSNDVPNYVDEDVDRYIVRYSFNIDANKVIYKY